MNGVNHKWYSVEVETGISTKDPALLLMIVSHDTSALLRIQSASFSI